MKNIINFHKNTTYTTKYESSASQLPSADTLLKVFAIGFFGYGLIELSFRGYTHWSMLLTGGACTLTLFYFNLAYKNAPLLLKAVGGSLIITVFEFFVGIIVNLVFGFAVWDYSLLPLNFLGQICLPFSIIWFFLCCVLLIILKLADI